MVAFPLLFFFFFFFFKAGNICDLLFNVHYETGSIIKGKTMLPKGKKSNFPFE